MLLADNISLRLGLGARLAIAGLALGAAVLGCGSSPTVGGPLESELSTQMNGQALCMAASGDEAIFFGMFMLRLDNELLKEQDVQVTGIGRREADLELPFEVRDVVLTAADGRPLLWSSVSLDSSGDVETVGGETYDGSSFTFDDLPVALSASDGTETVAVGVIVSAADEIDLDQPAFVFNKLEYSVGGENFVLEDFERELWIETASSAEWDGSCDGFDSE